MLLPLPSHLSHRDGLEALPPVPPGNAEALNFFDARPRAGSSALREPGAAAPAARGEQPLVLHAEAGAAGGALAGGA